MNSKRDTELLQRVRIFISKLVYKKWFEQSLAQSWLSSSLYYHVFGMLQIIFIKIIKIGSMLVDLGAAWPSGQRIGLAIQWSRVQVLL